MSVKGYGSPGFSKVNSGALVMELFRKNPDVGVFLMVHNAIGMEVIDKLGDQE
jgi:hypothetical protein